MLKQILYKTLIVWVYKMAKEKQYGLNKDITNRYDRTMTSRLKGRSLNTFNMCI